MYLVRCVNYLVSLLRFLFIVSRYLTWLNSIKLSLSSRFFPYLVLFLLLFLVSIVLILLSISMKSLIHNSVPFIFVLATVLDLHNSSSDQVCSVLLIILFYFLFFYLLQIAMIKQVHPAIQISCLIIIIINTLNIE